MKLGYFVSKKIDNLAKKAEIYLNNGDSLEAISKYNEIIDLLPEPKENWEAYEWAIVSIADTYFVAKNYEKAYFYFSKVISDESNPFVFLRFGQTNYYLKNNKDAVKYLGEAYDICGEDIFNDEDKIFLEIARKDKPTKKSSLDIPFDNMFRLPLEYQYLEKEYMGFQKLWNPIEWEKIYCNYSDFFEKIPEQLYTNSIAFLCASAVLESAIHLNKKDVFSKWLNVIEITSIKRMDHGVVEVWYGICELYNDNEEGAMYYFEKAEEKGTSRILKDFRHFGDEIYKFYYRKLK